MGIIDADEEESIQDAGVWLQKLSATNLLQIINGTEKVDTGEVWTSFGIDSPDPDWVEVHRRRTPEEMESYKERFTALLKELICGKDKKYAELRKRISKAADQSTGAVVGALAVALGTMDHIVSAMLVPVAAKCLMAILEVIRRLGKDAYCAGKREAEPVKLEIKRRKLIKN